jgi:predicted nucleic acid-binding protein
MLIGQSNFSRNSQHFRRSDMLTHLCWAVAWPYIWELRHNFTAYDAAYIALAEATGSVLYTCDEKLGRGHRARVVVFRS